MKRIKDILGGGVRFADRVLFGTKLGKLAIVAGLIALGVPAIEAGTIADVINTALDVVTEGA